MCFVASRLRRARVPRGRARLSDVAGQPVRLSDVAAGDPRLSCVAPLASRSKLEPFVLTPALGPALPDAGVCDGGAGCSARCHARIDELRAQLAAARGDLARSPGLRGHSHGASVLTDGRTVAMSADELAAMRSVFDAFDGDRDGRVSVSDLQRLHAKLGEPVTAEEAAEAVALLALDGGSSVTFDDFAKYWDGSSPAHSKTALYSRAGAASGGAVAPSARDAARRSYAAKFKFIKARMPSGSLGKVFTVPSGAESSLEYRLAFFFQERDGAERVPISPWHDIPLRNASSSDINMVVEIPKWTRAKMEITTTEPYNPIRQDVKNGIPRIYAYGDQLFNYGALPQTWEDPAHRSPDTGCLGDNDPLDAVEIGSKQWATGSVVRVKVLGVIGLIDAGETDWKLIVISSEDAMAPLLNDVADVRVHLPGLLEALTRWLRDYKLPEVQNAFAFGGEPRGRAYAEALVAETHAAWSRLVAGAEGTGGAGAGGAHATADGDARNATLSKLSAGLARSSSNTDIARMLGHTTD